MISDKLIKELIQEGEGPQLEFKDTIKLDAIGKTICAFLNGEGGQLIVGVKDNGVISGVKEAEKSELEISNFLISAIVPEAPITVTAETIDDKKLIVVKVWSGSKKPYIFQGTIFNRRGEKTIQANSHEISAFIHERQQAELHWERQTGLGVELNDLDQEEISEAINQIKEAGRGKDLSNNVIDFLSNYGLFNNGKVTNAAVVLFGLKPAQILPQCRVRITVFTSDKTGSSFDYDRFFEGNIFYNANEIFNFFETSIGIFSQFNNNSWQRTDRQRYPIQALREGVLNALIHRDYSNVSGSVLIGVYPDRIEISNYGELPKELSTSDLKKNHLSLPRNPDIAHICFLRGWIEKIGRGTLKIVDECKKAGLKEPKWVSKSGVTTLTFFGPQIKKKQISIEELNDRQRKLIQDLNKGEAITVFEYLGRIGGKLTDRTARNDLSVLVEGGWLSKQGKGSHTKYYLEDKER